MPYFKWFGYTPQGAPQVGYRACMDTHELKKVLEQEQITYIHGQPVGITGRRVSFSDRQEILQELSNLLQAHVRLAQAFAILSSLVKKEYPKQVLIACRRAVQEGKPFTVVAQHYPDLFDILTIHALRAGYHAGLLEKACSDRAAQLREIAVIRSKIRTALLLPGLTALFLFVMVSFLIFFIVPQFKKIFDMLNTPLPGITRFLLDAGAALTLIRGLVVVGIAAGGTLIFLSALKTAPGKKATDWVSLYIPVIGSFYRDFARAQALQSIALLMSSGQTLAQAIGQAADSFHNKLVRQDLITLQKSIQMGKRFSQALQESAFFGREEIITGVAVAEETAQLAAVLEQLSLIFRNRAVKRLERASFLIQPLLLALLGIVIGTLLLALYLPLLQIPQAF